MKWKDLTSEEQLSQIIQLSAEKPQVIFKHSTRCSISDVAKSRLERNTFPEDMDFYYLDLLNHRSLSQKIAETFGVVHESPQVLVIKDGKCVFDASHMAIRFEDIVEQAQTMP